jgi:hypothetical protein
LPHSFLLFPNYFTIPLRAECGLKMVLYKFIKNTIPQILKLEFNGFREELLEYFSFLQMSLILRLYNNVFKIPKKYKKN